MNATITAMPDTATTDDGTVFHRRRDGVFPSEPYAMRFQADRPLTDDDILRLAQAIGYAYRATVRGESLGRPVRDGDDAFTVDADTTKSSSDDLGIALEDFEETFPRLIREGSPVRKTDRSGPGTRGTSLVPAFRDPSVSVAVYYDYVISF